MTQSVYIADETLPVTARIKQRLTFLGENAHALNGFRLVIEGGAHAGIETVVESKRFSIGSATTDDLVLLGDGLAESHVEITPDRSLSRGIKIEAVGGPVEIVGKAKLHPGEWALVTGAAVLDMNGATVRVAPVIDTGEIARVGILVASVAALAFLVVSIAATSWGHVSQSVGTLVALTTLVEREGRTFAAPISAQATLNDVRVKLNELGLAHMITSNVLDDGSIKVDGMVPEQMSTAWMSFLQWFDAQPAYPAIVNAVAITGQDADLPSIATVWLGEQPMVEFSDGSRGQIGSLLAGGWRIVSIEQQAVAFERNGALISVNF